MNLTITRDDDAGTMHIAFSEPVVSKQGSIMELRLKEPTARQVLDAERLWSAENPWAARVAIESKLIASVAGISPLLADALPIGASNYAAEFLQEFIEAGNKVGDDDGDEPPDGPVTIELDKPITFLGEEYERIELREPMAVEIRKARMLMKTSGSLFEGRRSIMSLVTSVSGLPAPVVDALPIRKLNEAARILSRFTGAGRRTGKT